MALPNPVMTASGTSGHGAELDRLLPLAELGAVVVKSLAAFPWAGNTPPRIHPTTAGMLNAVGLQGPGLPAWLESDLPALLAAGARVVVSIWGRTTEEYAAAAALVRGTPAQVVAVEVNLSCPNLEDRREMFAHSPEATQAVLEATAACGRPRWAKLSPNTSELVDVAAAAAAGGADAVTLVNTVRGMVLDRSTGRPALGNGGGGLSGPAIHPIAVQAVHDVRTALRELPIVGVGGVVSGHDAADLLLAGASAVQVGTAIFAEPRAPRRVLAELAAWADRRGIRRLSDVVGATHRGGLP